jgi:hypothetical protein
MEKFFRDLEEVLFFRIGVAAVLVVELYQFIRFSVGHHV